MKTYIIYRHVNKINGKSYIGQTCQKVTNRWKNGNGYVANKQQVFYKAIQKYGWDNFTHEILESNIETIEKANEREQYWIEHYHTWVLDPNCNGYNITQGGDGSAGRPMSNTTKQKLKKQVYCSELDKTFDSITAAAKETGCAISKICACCRGLMNSINGYHWTYTDDKLKQIAIEKYNQRFENKQSYWSSISTPVYCVIDTKKIYFSSKKEAAIWWFENYKPFGNTFNKSLYFKKINQSIEGKTIISGKNQYDYEIIDNIKWFLGEDDNGRKFR